MPITAECIGKREISLEHFWDRPLPDLLHLLQATPAGLTSDEAKRRLRLYGSNSLMQESRFAPLVSFLRLVANPLIIILLIASGVSLALGDPIGGLIIISIVLRSVLLNFSMEFHARHAVKEIRKQVAATAAVIRDGRKQEPPIAESDVAKLGPQLDIEWSRASGKRAARRGTSETFSANGGR